MEEMHSQMEEMHRARCVGQNAEFLCSLSELAAVPKSPRSPKLSILHPFEVLWRLHYICMIDILISHEKFQPSNQSHG